MSYRSSPVRAYDFLLKFLLVGDSDVGKGEILASLQDGATESPYGYNMGIDYKTTTILLDGRRVKLQLWDTSGQGRFCTIFRSYSRGAQGVILVYDITNRWSFDGIDRWIKEIDEVSDESVSSTDFGRRHHNVPRWFEDYCFEALSFAFCLFGHLLNRTWEGGAS
ncbi:ras-related protein Rab-40B-like [Micropterus salmoides]|uniref:ras-related protein Rab-40B-like n=1 Tax=Micropterus salmoides TaxID=27706 RepID=UPI0018ED1FD6|nr:ras-related protein Rab-40B-like [Micropterus salmoides]